MWAQLEPPLFSTAFSSSCSAKSCFREFLRRKLTTLSYRYETIPWFLASASLMCTAWKAGFYEVATPLPSIEIFHLSFFLAPSMFEQIFILIRIWVSYLSKEMSTRRIKKLDSKIKGNVIEKYSTAAKLSLKPSTTLKLHIAWLAHRIHHYRFAFRWWIARGHKRTSLIKRRFHARESRVSSRLVSPFQWHRRWDVDARNTTFAPMPAFHFGVLLRIEIVRAATLTDVLFKIV